MAADDPLTPGEIRRSLRRLEDEDRSLAERITRVAAEMLPVKLWDAEHRALGDKLDRHEKAADADRQRVEKAIEDLREDLRKEIKDVREDREKTSQVTWQKVLGLIATVVAIVGLVITLIGQSKGIH